MKITTIGMLLLAIYLIFTGLVVFVPALAFNGHMQIQAGLAIAAGILILLNK